MDNQIQVYKEEINLQISNKETFNSLMNITFKGLTEQNAKRAMLEAMMRGFKFKDFLENNIYAIPFGNNYSLVTSIDYNRKIGMKSGIVGVSEPLYVENEGKIISCTITVKRKISDYIGEYTAKVYFDEFNTNKNLWKTKPHLMIAKVAEMHALRKACPEELSQAYIEEEFDKENSFEKIESKLDKTLELLKRVPEEKRNLAVDNAIKSGEFNEEECSILAELKKGEEIINTDDIKL